MYVHKWLWFIQKKFIKGKFGEKMFIFILLLKRNLQIAFWIERTFCNIYLHYLFNKTCSTRRNSKWEILTSHLFLKILSPLKKFKIYAEENFFPWLFRNKIESIIEEDPRWIEISQGEMHNLLVKTRAFIMKNFEIFRIGGFSSLFVSLRKGISRGKWRNRIA